MGNKEKGLGGLGELMGRMNKLVEDAQKQAADGSACAGSAAAHAESGEAVADDGQVFNRAVAGGFAQGGFSSGGGAPSYGSSSQGSSELVEESRVLKAAHVPGKALSIETINGGVRARQQTGEGVAIQAIIRCETKERLAQTKIVVKRGADGKLSIGVAWPEGEPRPSEGCSFEVGIPDAQGVELRTSNGTALVAGLAGTCEIRSANGGIQVAGHDGDVSAITANGAVDVEGVSGNLIARSVNGKIGIVRVGGDVQADTQNGNVRLELADGQQGPFRLQTSNASIDLEIGGGFNGVVQMETTNGKVKFEDSGRVEVLRQGRSMAEVKVGTGGPASSARTSNAAIRAEFE